ncbi:MAG: hypothetical protein ACE5FD_01515 [Anaerolineae bacterium]
MSQLPSAQLTPLQQIIIDVVRQHPGQFFRSSLAKMLVGAKSWQNKEFPEYGRFSKYRRKDIGYQIDILLQQSYLALDAFNHLVVPQE